MENTKSICDRSGKNASAYFKSLPALPELQVLFSEHQPLVSILLIPKEKQILDWESTFKIERLDSSRWIKYKATLKNNKIL